MLDPIGAADAPFPPIIGVDFQCASQQDRGGNRSGKRRQGRSRTGVHDCRGNFKVPRTIVNGEDLKCVSCFAPSQRSCSLVARLSPRKTEERREHGIARPPLIPVLNEARDVAGPVRMRRAGVAAAKFVRN